MKVDSHTHPFERDETLDGMRLFVEQARAKGFEEISFTEHGALLPGRTDEFFRNYAKFALQLKDESSFPRINFGIELDYHPTLLREAAAIVAEFPFDYVLGSVHVHTGLYSGDISGKSFDETVEFALSRILEAVESGVFDTITHFDFYRILLGDNQDEYVPSRHKDTTLEVFKAMERCGVCLEVNSSSLRRPINDLHPTPEILEWARDFDLKYTFASDAHEPHLVGAGYEEVMNALSDSQRAHLVTFRSRKPFRTGSK